MLPLEGISVIDLTNLLPGPFCTMMMGDLGAKVIKIERPPLGDPMRQMSPGMFEAVNRNKKSVALDLKQDQARSNLAKLITEADVFIEGFRPGVIAKLGFSYETVRSLNKNIIYCSLSGYGQNSPYQDRPSHDINYLAVSGVLSISGDPYGPPAPWSGIQVADLCASMYAMVAIQAALSSREKTGEGSYIDVSITDCLLSWLGPRIGEYYERGIPSKGNFVGRGAYGAYETKDGKYIAIACVENNFWQNLCKLLDLHELERNEQYSTWIHRMEKAQEINPLLQKKFLEKDGEEWLELCEAAEVPYSLVNSIEELVKDPHIKMSGLIHEQNGTPSVSFPVKFDWLEIKSAGRCPKCGEHNIEIL